ncbi:MAG TPA: flavoprotein, partial [Candidatus Wallbacteria bacterium]|nr:flavoprotein [Candidatus Wallbacteria bacterium]
VLGFEAAADQEVAGGLAESLTGALFLANNFRKPYLIAPAMNSNMYEHPATRRSLKQLEDWGCEVYPTGEGMLACGAIGKGRLIEPDEIFKDIERRFS